MKLAINSNVQQEQDCQNCGNYLTVMEQVLATKTKKMLCEFCLVAK